MSLEKDFKILQRKIDRIQRARERTIFNNYKSTLADLKKTMERIYSKYEIDGQLTFTEMSKHDRINKLDKEMAKAFQKLYSENSKLTRATLKSIYTTGYKDTMSIVENAANKKIRGILKPINVTKTINDEMAGLNWATRLRQGRNNAIVQVQRSVRQGLSQGMTYNQVSKLLADELGKDVIQPTRIIRTETKRVVEQAKKDSLDHANNQGVKMVKKWLSARDERTRDRHYDMDGVTIPYEEDFVILETGSRGPAPGLMEGSDSASDNINCRCTFIIDIVEQ